MVGKDIYTNCGMVGQTEWPDGEVGRSGRTEWPDGEARDTQWASRADGHPDGCPTEGGRAPDGDREWPDEGLDVCPTEGGVLGGGPTAGLRGGPTGDYIRAGGPPFWTLSSCAQSHLQEMRERRVLMSESGPLRGEFRKECSPPHCFYN
jgi:hypothetical protein